MENWTVRDVLRWATEDFAKRQLASARLEAEVLLASTLQATRLQLYTGFDRPMSAAELTAYRQAIQRRRNGEPSAYIVGQREFWSLAFEVNEAVLVPRPETELLVEAACARLVGEARILDLCTGSGCVAIALAKERPAVEVDAVDLSASACEVAVRNVERHGVANRVRIFTGDLFAPLPSGSQYSVIISNPPYVPDGEIAGLSVEVRREPRLALAGGIDGLDVIRRIIAAAPQYLLPGACLLIELDSRQVEAAVRAADEASAIAHKILFDLGGNARVVEFQWNLV